MPHWLSIGAWTAVFVIVCGLAFIVGAKLTNGHLPRRRRK